MAFNTTVGRTEYIASTAQTAFPFLFKIYFTKDIKVYLTPVGQVPNDANDLLKLGVHYSVSINGDNGGDITLVTGATNGHAVTIKRSLDIDRIIEYQVNGDLLADTLNIDQNYQTYLISDQNTQNDRNLVLPVSAQSINPELASPIPNAYIGWSPDGKTLVNLAATDSNLPQPSFPTDEGKTLCTMQVEILLNPKIQG